MSGMSGMTNHIRVGVHDEIHPALFKHIVDALKALNSVHGVTFDLTRYGIEEPRNGDAAGSES